MNAQLRIPINALPVRVEVLAHGDVPSDLMAAWQELAHDCAEPNSFMESWFAIPALRYHGQGEARLIAVWQGSALIGVMAVAVAARYGRLSVRHTANWLGPQGFYGAPLVRSGFEKRFWQAALTTLNQADWAPGFLSLAGVDEAGPVLAGLRAATAALARPCPIVHRYERALLRSDLAPDAYLEASLRGKKRKELRRQRNRLSETGALQFRTFGEVDKIEDWIADFLALEAAGWKGSDGAAFANTADDRSFFRAIITGAHVAGCLEILRFDLDGRAIAMLINFLRPPGSFSFKIAYDEALARFSPGVLIELENLARILTNPAVEWMDSCAAPNHPMIDGLWMERRSIVQVAVPLTGARRRLTYAVCRTIERAAAFARKQGWR